MSTFVLAPQFGTYKDFFFNCIIPPRPPSTPGMSYSDLKLLIDAVAESLGSLRMSDLIIWYVCAAQRGCRCIDLLFSSPTEAWISSGWSLKL